MYIIYQYIYIYIYIFTIRYIEIDFSYRLFVINYIFSLLYNKVGYLYLNIDITNIRILYIWYPLLFIDILYCVHSTILKYLTIINMLYHRYCYNNK